VSRAAARNLQNQNLELAPRGLGSDFQIGSDLKHEGAGLSGVARLFGAGLIYVKGDVQEHVLHKLTRFLRQYHA
jgi:hypothetical protein